MKKYKLLKDLFDLKAGEVSEATVNSYGDIVFKNSGKLPSVVFNEKELDIYIRLGVLEEVKEEEWPKNGDKYYCIDGNSHITSLIWSDDIVDNWLGDFTGIYRTYEEAEAMRDKIREFVKKELGK